jgi:serine/threonine protein kinase/tetratricopeptide (TPR) repeat protein
MSAVQVPTRLGPYELIECLGQGGMASVYRGYQPNMDRYVAIKVIHRWLESEQSGLERFQREARMVARLEHPHILPVYDYNGSHQPPYIVMRLMSATLKDVLASNQAEPGWSLHLFQQIASALDYAHRQGVVHRDIKPSNIMLDEQNNAFLADFGLARPVQGMEITQSGYMIGTPGYMAPEQGLASRDASLSADLYSLAVMLYEMLTGQLPYQAPGLMEMLLKQLQEPHTPVRHYAPRLPEPIEAVFSLALSKDPLERYPDAVSLYHAAARALDITPQESAFPSASLTLHPGHKPAGIPLTPSLARRRRPSEQNKQVTVLYIDAAEHERTLLEQPGSDLQTSLADLWEQVEAVIQAQSSQAGLIVSRTSTSLTLLWGADQAREDDPERAIRLALDLQEAALPYALDGLLPLQICLTTGMARLTPLLLSSSEETGSSAYSASGPAITTAARLPASIPDGGIAITHTTYRLVQGLFEVEALPPIKVRGSSQKLVVYQVFYAKPRVLHVAPRAVEGIETRLVGRDAELLQLRDALEAAEEGESQMVTITGDAGLGKSRLLYAFFQWYELRPQSIPILRGRALPDLINQPYALLREMLAFRFEIQDRDSREVVQQKVEQGVEKYMGQGSVLHAHLLGQLAGFDFSGSLLLESILKDAHRFTEQAQASMLAFIHAVSLAGDAAILELEDLHWADEASLDLIQRIVPESPDDRLLVLCTARPELLKRRPQWGRGQSFHRRIELAPLTRRESRKLVHELLQKVGDLPDGLRDWLVDHSEGNPLYLEELVKMLIEERVILREDDAWRVEMGRLEEGRVPPPLTGVLQARLDSLTPDERVVLQRASAAGRIFWDAGLAALESADDLEIDTREVLASLRRRDLVVPREAASVSLGGSQEYIFLSSMLRDVTYTTILPRLRRRYHAVLAEWLLQVCGERINEYTASIAHHFELAGEHTRAAEYLLKTAEQACAVGAYSEGLSALEGGLRLVEAAEEDREKAARLKVRLLTQLGELYSLGRAEHSQSAVYLEQAAALARSQNNLSGLALALAQLGRVNFWIGRLDRGREYLEESIELSRKEGFQDILLFVLRQAGNTAYYQNRLEEACQYLQESLELARKAGEKSAVVASLNSLGLIDLQNGEEEAALSRFEEGLDLARQVGDRRSEILILNNMADLFIRQHRLDRAVESAQLALEISRRIGANAMVASAYGLLGNARVEQGRLEEGRRYLNKALRLFHALGEHPHILTNLLVQARCFWHAGQQERAAELMGLVQKQPSLSLPIQTRLEHTIKDTLQVLPDEEIAAGLARGAQLSLEAVVLELLEESGAG